VELGQRLGVTKQAAARTAASLEERGFITRVPSRTDGRERLLVPTQRGRQMLSLSASIFLQQVQQWRARVGDDSVDATLTTLSRADPGRRGPTDISDWA
jgi:DNA-binding MarR family transcriptional regulator